MTTKYCSNCSSIQKTKAVSFSCLEDATSTKRNWYDNRLKDIISDNFNLHYFVRKLECLRCGSQWETLEINRTEIDSLISMIKSDVANKAAHITYVKHLLEIISKRNKIIDECSKLVEGLKEVSKKHLSDIEGE